MAIEVHEKNVLYGWNTGADPFSPQFKSLSISLCFEIQLMGGKVGGGRWKQNMWGLVTR